MTGSDSRTQSRRKQIFYHQTEDPFTIQKLAGHSDVPLTTHTYAHVQVEALRRAVGVLDRLGLEVEAGEEVGPLQPKAICEDFPDQAYGWTDHGGQVREAVTPLPACPPAAPQGNRGTPHAGAAASLRRSGTREGSPP